MMMSPQIYGVNSKGGFLYLFSQDQHLAKVNILSIYPKFSSHTASIFFLNRDQRPEKSKTESAQQLVYFAPSNWKIFERHCLPLLPDISLGGTTVANSDVNSPISHQTLSPSGVSAGTFDVRHTHLQSTQANYSSEWVMQGLGSSCLISSLPPAFGLWSLAGWGSRRSTYKHKSDRWSCSPPLIQTFYCELAGSSFAPPLGPPLGGEVFVCLINGSQVTREIRSPSSQGWAGGTKGPPWKQGSLAHLPERRVHD